MRGKVVKVLLLACLLAVVFAPLAEAAVRVRGYYRSDGTYVGPHYRSDPDGYFWNNWSSWGNYNPYTGQRGYRTYDSYLRSRLSSYDWDYDWSYSYTPRYYSTWDYDWSYSYSPLYYSTWDYSWSSYYTPSSYRSYSSYYWDW